MANAQVKTEDGAIGDMLSVSFRWLRTMALFAVLGLLWTPIVATVVAMNDRVNSSQADPTPIAGLAEIEQVGPGATNDVYAK